MDEHAFIRAVHRKLPSAVYRWKINARFQNGVPDAWYCGEAGSLWIEYKYRPTTPSRRWTVALRPLQKLWLNARSQEGQTVIVVVGCPDGAFILTDRAWDQPQPPSKPHPIQRVAECIIRTTLST